VVIYLRNIAYSIHLESIVDGRLVIMQYGDNLECNPVNLPPVSMNAALERLLGLPAPVARRGREEAQAVVTGYPSSTSMAELYRD
jgi:hypothetical protein